MNQYIITEEQKTPDDPLNYATMAILARIGKQAEFKEAWEKLENAERNYICGDIYNIVKSARSHPYQSEKKFNESTGRGYRCIHCEVRNDVLFCHYHDTSIQSERDIPSCKVPEGAILKLCECGNDTFRFIETADWLVEIEQWEGDELLKLCTKCGKDIGCVSDAKRGKSISRKTLAELRQAGKP